MLMSGSALAVPNVSDNTVRFLGEVSNQTCSLNINGNEKSPVVLLPTVSINEFKNSTAAVVPGQTAGETEFTINISGCSATKDDDDAAVPNMETALRIAFLGNVVTASQNLGNTGDAADISIQLVDDGDTAFAFTPGDLIRSTKQIQIADNGEVSPTTYKVRYYSESAQATPGSVIASAQYAITYK